MNDPELVIHCKDLLRSRRFYECLGLQFIESKIEHGGGLTAESVSGRVVRLRATTSAILSTVFVLRVRNIDQVYSAMMRNGFMRFDHNEYIDPDGNRVRLPEPWRLKVPEEV